ncbi:hypothetical protein AJ80_03524 [Polytolypa hystricis UAMH7299]|uniref:C3H1-type domain-containing protein n=1 Tax=Polytolypa hystricis (strain UAMH7299) TaxID=1447883 RepID=A0A2B7YIC4_POLH7|nr:hypothetical protein AJ80_03524 [Polytolypa hystricis UAMH7299]
MSSSPRPQFYITRLDGTNAALIAVDELPESVNIHGVPRALPQEDTNGMMYLGTVAARNQYYVINVDTSALARQTGSENDQAGNGSSGPMVFIPGHAQPGLAAWNAGSQDENSEGSKALTRSPKDVKRSAARHSKSTANQNAQRKEYCSFWIRHGECDYQQQGKYLHFQPHSPFTCTNMIQGCMYKHYMPTDPETLEKLGLRDVPKWYREKFGVKSVHTANNDSSRPELGRSWRPGARGLSPPSLSRAAHATSSSLTIAGSREPATRHHARQSMSQSEARDDILTPSSSASPELNLKQATAPIPPSQQWQRQDFLAQDLLNDDAPVEPFYSEASQSGTPFSSGKQRFARPMPHVSMSAASDSNKRRTVATFDPLPSTTARFNPSWPMPQAPHSSVSMVDPFAGNVRSFPRPRHAAAPIRRSETMNAISSFEPSSSRPSSQRSVSSSMNVASRPHLSVDTSANTNSRSTHGNPHRSGPRGGMNAPGHRQDGQKHQSNNGSRRHGMDGIEEDVFNLGLNDDVEPQLAN